jgi:O-6-methylguanine DNA methyltransferase
MYKKNDIYREENIAYLQSPTGLIEIQSNNSQITALEFIKEKRYEEKTNPLLKETLIQLREYFAGRRKTFNLPLELNGTDFQNRVWKELLKIPYGETLSYGELARKIGNEKASRAVGYANNRNRIAIIIPCHRVIGINGKLIGYKGGLWRKKWLLEHEQRMY